jgi:hypothetical protein
MIGKSFFSYTSFGTFSVIELMKKRGTSLMR